MADTKSPGHDPFFVFLIVHFRGKFDVVEMFW